MKKVLLITLSFLLTAFTYSQTVTNVTPIPDNDKMIVKYKITGAKLNQEFNVSLYVSMDGGTSYTGPLKAISGDIGEGITEGEHSMVWDIFKDVNSLAGSIVFDVRAIVIETTESIKESNIKSKKIQKDKKKFFVSYMGSTNAPVGISIGQLGKTGWYCSVKSSIFQKKAEYVYEGDNLKPAIGSSEYYNFNDTREIRKLSLTLGLTQQLGSNVFWYIGGGYGMKQQIWQIDIYTNNQKTGSAYVENPEKSYSGFESETGLTIRTGGVLFSVGITNINLKSTKLTFGFGLIFK